MERNELVNELLRIQSAVGKLLNRLDVMEEELLESDRTNDKLKILLAMVRERVDVFQLDLLTASDIAGALSLSHELYPDLLRRIGVPVRKRTVTPIQAGMLAKAMPFSKKYQVVKGKHTVRVWSLKGDYTKLERLTSAQMYEHYHVQFDNFVAHYNKPEPEKKNLADIVPPTIDPPTFL